MKTFSWAMAGALSMLAATIAQAQTTYSVDPVHSTILFRVKHNNAAQFWGRFNEPTGTVAWDENDPAKSSVEVSVKAANLDTHQAKRDQDLSGPDFFNSKQYPELTFKSTSIKKSGDNMYEVAGDMTIKGVTKPITAQVEMTGSGKGMRGEPRAGWEATFTIDRNDFGVSGMPNGVGNDVKIIAAIEGAVRR